MLKLAGLALFCLAANSQGIAHELVSHTCIHDHPETQRALHGIHALDDVVEGATVVELGRRRPFGSSSMEGPSEIRTTLMVKQNYGGDVKDRAFRATAESPIRFSFRFNNLDNTSNYCTTATGSSPDMQGGRINCTQDTIFNSTMRALLTETVLPQAAAILSQFLSVVPVVGNLTVPTGAVCGSAFTIPSSDSSYGVPNADIVMYVSAAPTTGTTIAWAGYCSVDSNGRPVIARSNFSPKYLYNAQSPSAIRSLVRTAVHEFLHSLGFSGTYFASSYFGTSNVVQSGGTRRGGQPVSLYKGSSALSAARNSFNCSSLDGIEIEDEGGSGTMGSHWERRTHKEDVMCGIAGNLMTLSDMTFSVMEDSGHYTVDRTKAEKDTFMPNAGCGVFANKCNTTEGGAGRYYCMDTNDACNTDFSGFGPCSVGNYSSDLPLYYQYFPGKPRQGGSLSLMNYCPVISPYSNRWCNNNQNTAANNSLTGNYYAADGRCFKTSSTLYRSATGPASNGPARCFQSRCPLGIRIEFAIADSEWAQCPLDGTSATITAPSPYSGTVFCPPASIFCTPELYYLPPNVTTTTVTTTTSTRPTTTTQPTTSTTVLSTTTARTTTTMRTTTRPTVTGRSNITRRPAAAPSTRLFDSLTITIFVLAGLCAFSF